MKNKYYQPKIEEFCVGFEYEYQEKDGWSKTEIFESSFTSGSTGLNEYIDNDFNFICENIDCGNIRVKHLDREDAEELGWVSDGSYFILGNYALWFDEKSIKIAVLGDYDFEENGFQGTILNKSELKKLMVMLNIEKK